jgi:hypothetical protein
MTAGHEFAVHLTVSPRDTITHSYELTAERETVPVAGRFPTSHRYSAASDSRRRNVADTDAACESVDSGCTSVRHLLTAVQQALSLPKPRRQSDRVPYLALLELRASVAVASIGRLLANPDSGELDFLSEGDHILHQLADLPPGGYRHQPE